MASLSNVSTAPSLCSTLDFIMSSEPITSIQNDQGKQFLISSLTSSSEISAFPKELSFDYRVSFENKDYKLACFNQVELDPNFHRSEIFAIKDEQDIIGISTLFVTPSKHLNTIPFVYNKENQIALTYLTDHMPISNPDTYVFEIGWFQLLTQYQNQKIASNFLYSFLIPKIQKLLYTKPSADILILVSAAGTGSYKEKQLFRKIWQTDPLQKISIEPDIYAKLGKVHLGARFTYFLVQKFEFDLLPNCYNFSLGPVFYKKIPH